MPLEIQIQTTTAPSQSDAITINLIGSLDTATAPELEHALGTIFAGPVKDIVFNLAELTFITSAGLRVFANMRRALRERGGQASFVNMQPQIQEVFEIIRSLPGVAIFKDLAEFDQYLARRQRTCRENL
jgi:anti-sigma B factor antagonist